MKIRQDLAAVAPGLLHTLPCSQEEMPSVSAQKGSLYLTQTEAAMWTTPGLPKATHFPLPSPSVLHKEPLLTHHLLVQMPTSPSTGWDKSSYSRAHVVMASVSDMATQLFSRDSLSCGLRGAP